VIALVAEVVCSDTAATLILNYGVKLLGRLIKNNYTNIALLKELTTTPPMTAQQHAEIMRKRIAHRRMVEEAKELKTVSEDVFGGQ
jgi:hypothetical protein